MSTLVRGNLSHTHTRSTELVDRDWVKTWPNTPLSLFMHQAWSWYYWFSQAVFFFISLHTMHKKHTCMSLIRASQSQMLRGGGITRHAEHLKATNLEQLCDPESTGCNWDLVNWRGWRLQSELFWLAEQQLFTLPWSKKSAGSPSIMGCSWGPRRLLDGEPCSWRVIRKEPLRPQIS